ncbi:hexosaminidase [Silvimonas terrae]|uniref:beta-N-acetylhexosaminidase n=1 Tax=Silvimonas terrae TaxID=300266 RepID=A0A840RJL6_9NEIS|nr:family 20 glycosylhydrolase [Silvimonas terrae]MBB5192413.1 hexosaminidase [Silvimonas terrae]
MNKRALLQPVLAAVLAAGFIHPAQAAAPNTSLPLMPYPAHVTQQAGALPLTGNFSAIATGPDAAALQPALADWLKQLQRQTGIPLTQALADQPGTATLRIKVEQAVADAVPPPDMVESYRLEVTDSGIILTAPQRYGALRGLQTLLQLQTTNSQGVVFPHVLIEDAPRFAWRGLLLDVSRHFIPVADVKRQLDGMAAARLNVLHWHLSDDQGWRIESLRYPKLQQLASDGQFYTQAQIRDVVAYAAQRGIRVVPEVDMPGHASAIVTAYPELAAAPGPYQIERHWGVFRPTLDPTNDDTWQFIGGLLDELTALFPDPYFHIGGDEVNAWQWNHNPQIQSFMQDQHLSDAAALQAWFNARLEKELEQRHRKMVGWDEIFHPDLPKTVMVQSWRGMDSLAQVANAGHPGLLSTGFYLDQPQAAAYHYRNELNPKPETFTAPVSGEAWQSWYFVIPRKRGSALKGSFTLVGDKTHPWRGYIDFDGQTRRAVRDIAWRGNQVSFWLDTWMGETRPVFTVDADPDTASGYFLLGNVAFASTAVRLKGDAPPEGQMPPVLAPDNAAHIQGGEAALWAEIVNPQTLDLRLWPRTFAVAERLWSPAELSDETSLYRRLKVMDRFSTVSVGTLQQAQMENNLRRLVSRGDIGPLRTLAEPVEQAQYYTRLYEKYGAGQYTSAEPLNRFADALPAESFAVHDLQQAVDALSHNRNDAAAQAALAGWFKRWQGNTPAVSQLLDANPALLPLRPVVEYADQVAALGLTLLAHCKSGKPLSAKERRNASTLLQNALSVRDEVVVGAARPVRALLWLTP